MHVHAADNVSHVSGERHYCIKGHTQVTYCLTRKYWCASSSQAGAQGSEFGLVMTRDYDLKLRLPIIKHLNQWLRGGSGRILGPLSLKSVKGTTPGVKKTWVDMLDHGSNSGKRFSKWPPKAILNNLLCQYNLHQLANFNDQKVQ